ncbi:putative ligase [Janibacter sp. HTCC2649]|uniref:5-formyltetrahydrofolate cyclo-ligase n=1 Tax=Janibacter sp. HTCC2649 TaxID=313589 RepID=UPI0000670FE8|nr:5-formyltetrahydrofolate cyclo-ligase [Janibacter sp. HTCC2649]EAP97167.1 putative ligase [Janibacter sp. HTCC2649]
MTEDRVSQDKAALRPTLLAARREIAAARDRAADDLALAARAIDLVRDLGITPGGTVAAYEALRTEPPTAATIDALVGHGIRVIVPITLADNDLDWCDAQDERRMPRGPDSIAAAGLVLTPGLGVDLVGTRLGRGGGSYDRALVRLRPDARVVVVLHPGEVHSVRLPRYDHDHPVHGMLTVDGITWLQAM